MEVSLQEAAAAIALQSIQAIKKEREKSITKALSILRWKDGKTKTSLPANEAEARISPQAYGGGILPWPQISSWVWLRLTSRRWEILGNCYT